ncbi:hypothetical protein [Streptomyces sp. NPDC086787]|uniref:AMIN-like domain-containing (lipo)protein n=1 Tax=Streptomyces sp. NPDC086787 TaxID=3365759 RepID=UPI00380EFDC1
MRHHQPHRHHLRRPTAVAAGLLLTLTATVGATASASAAAPSRPAAAQALVVNARWGGHCTYDRLVFDVKGTVPTVTVRPVTKLIYDPSGKKVPLSGKYFLEVRFSPAAAHNASGQSVYRGPRLTKIGLPVLKGLALTGDFEGVVTFGAAYGAKPVPKTSVLHSPERYVLDVPHAKVC